MVDQTVGDEVADPGTDWQPKDENRRSGRRLSDTARLWAIVKAPHGVNYRRQHSTPL
jgi:hypothetical protein